MRNMLLIQDVVEFFNENQSTVRSTAKHFGISKSAVHTYLTKYMPNPISQAILEKNKNERHIRGGMALQAKMRAKKANNKSQNN